MKNKWFSFVALLLLASCTLEPPTDIRVPEPWAPVPGPVEERPFVAPEPFDFCPGGVMVRDPKASISKDCNLIEYPNGTREKVNCVYLDDLMIHYRCVNATKVK